jgi:hypothetical protein
MRFNQMRTFCILILFVSQCFAVMNAEKVITKDDKQYEFLIGLNLGMTAAPGSATHIGGGHILTAAHVILGLPDFTGTNVPISLTGSSGELIGFLKPEDYDLILPPSKSSKEVKAADGRIVRVPQPDIAIIRLKGALKSQVEALPSVALRDYTVQKGDELKVAGRGATDFKAPVVKPIMEWKIGSVLVTGSDENGERIITTWIDIPELKDFSSVLPGDSGGPILIEKEGQIFQVGVTNSVIEQKGKNEEVILFSTYQSLNSDVVRPWIENEVKKY